MNIETMGVAPIAAIVIICWLVAYLLRATTLDNKWLPVICGGCGAILGLLGWLLGVDSIPAADPFTALAVGIVSGFAATGIHQVGKQLQQ